MLSDGLLCSFLTYFSGTVDPFHLGTTLETASWRKHFRCAPASPHASKQSAMLRAVVQVPPDSRTGD